MKGNYPIDFSKKKDIWFSLLKHLFHLVFSQGDRKKPHIPCGNNHFIRYYPVIYVTKWQNFELVPRSNPVRSRARGSWAMNSSYRRRKGLSFKSHLCINVVNTDSINISWCHGVPLYISLLGEGSLCLFPMPHLPRLNRENWFMGIPEVEKTNFKWCPRQYPALSRLGH